MPGYVVLPPHITDPFYTARPFLNQTMSYLFQIAAQKAQHKLKMEESDRLLALEKIEAEKERDREKAKLEEGRRYTEKREAVKERSRLADKGVKVTPAPTGEEKTALSITGAPAMEPPKGQVFNPLAQGYHAPPAGEAAQRWETQAPFRVGSNLVMPQKNLTTGKMEYPKFPLDKKGKIDPEVKLKAGTQLRKEYTQGSKIFVDVRNSYGRVMVSAQNPSPAGDLAMIFNFMKMLDPESVVREGEFATAANTGSIPQRVWAMYNKMLSGERLTKTQRKDFFGQAQRLYKKQLKRHTQFTGQYTRLSKSYGVPKENVIIDYTIPEDELAKGVTNREVEVSDEQLAERKRLEQKYGLSPDDME